MRAAKGSEASHYFPQLKMLALLGHSFWSFYLRINALQFVAALLYAAFRTVERWQRGPRPMPTTPPPPPEGHPLVNRTSLVRRARGAARRPRRGQAWTGHDS